MENASNANVERLLSIVAIQQEIATAKLDLNTVMSLVADRMRTLTGASGAAVELVEDDELVYRAASGTLASHLGMRLKISASISGLSVRSGGIMRSDDTETDERVDREACRRIRARSMVVVPLEHGRRTVGVLKVSSVEPGAFGEEEVYTLQFMTALIAAGMSHTAQFEAEQALLEERTQALEKIRRSEDHLRAIFEQSAVGVAETDRSGRFVLLNQRYCEIMGYSREELLKLRMRDITHPDDLPENLRLLNRLWREGAEFDIEKRYVRKDGSVMWVNNAVSPRWDGSNAPSYAVAVVQDITWRKRREANAAFLAEIQDDCARLSSAGEIMRTVGEKLGAYLGVSSSFLAEIDDERGQGLVHHLWNTEDAPPIPSVLSMPEFMGEEFYEVVRSGEPFVIEDAETDPLAGARTYAALGIRSVVAVPFFKGGEWRYLLAVCDSRPRQWREDEIELYRELANRVFPRIERAKAEEELRGREAFISAVTESARAVIIVQELSGGRVVYVNSYIQDLLGYEPEEIYEMSYEQIIDTANPEDAEAVNGLVEDCREAKNGEVLSLEFRNRRKSGEYRWIRATSTPFGERDGRGKATQVLHVCEDITESKRAEEALLEIREAERRRIARDLHDSVLQDISGALQTIQALQAERSGGGGSEDEGLEQSLDALRQAVGGLREAIYDLRRDDQKPLVSEVEALVELNRQMKPECDLALHVESGFPDEVPEAMNRELLRIVHESLINIRRHSGARRANVTLGSKGGEVWAAILDDGRGFDQAETPEGMGLSGMRERAAAVGGKLDLRSEPGRGTSVTMIIALPRS